MLAGGKLYARDPAGNLVLDAQTGSQLGTFQASAPPAFAGGVGYFVHDGVMDARDAVTQNLLWTFAGDGQLVTAPIVANGYVYVGSTSGHLFAVAAATGQAVWWGSVPGGFPAPDGPNAPTGPISGLAVGQGILVAPSLGGFTVFSGGGPLSGIRRSRALRRSLIRRRPARTLGPRALRERRS